AEDGIRDFHVTGVPTCALPIYGMLPSRSLHASSPARMWNAPSTRDPARKLRDGCMPCPPKLTPDGKMRAAATTATLAVHGSSLQDRKSGVQGKAGARARRESRR